MRKQKVTAEGDLHIIASDSHDLIKLSIKPCSVTDDESTIRTYIESQNEKLKNLEEHKETVQLTKSLKYNFINNEDLGEIFSFVKTGKSEKLDQFMKLAKFYSNSQN